MNETGEMKAGRIGITLSVEEFNELVKLIPQVKTVLQGLSYETLEFPQVHLCIPSRTKLS